MSNVIALDSFRRAWRFVVAAMLCAAFAITRSPEAMAADDTGSAIRQILDTGSATDFNAGALDLLVLRAFYARNNYQPVWSGSPQSQSDRDVMLDALARADEDGLEPEDYRRAAAIQRVTTDTAYGNAERDLVLTNEALRYANDIHSGRRALRNIDDDVEMPTNSIDAGSELLGALQGHSLKAFLAGLPPQEPEYARLREALAHYRGRAYASEELSNSGEYGGRESAPRSTVRRSLSERELAIIANMERWRWLPSQLESEYVMVNAASAELEVVQNGNVILNSRVIVGRPSDRTPIIRAVAEGVLVNPPWNVPEPIVRREIMPKLRRNPGYLRAHNMVYRRGGGIEQRPGSRNALGRIKLELPNDFDVYLHDTPSKSLFAESDRHLSHGCVRVEEIRSLASFALTDDTQSVSSVSSAVAAGRTAYLPLSRPLPIYIMYWTVFANADGAVEFRPDIYGRDQRLIAALGANRGGRMTSNL